MALAGMNVTRIAGLLGLLLGATAYVAAQDVYPSRPVRLIVTAAPGGVVDVTARIISQQLAEQVGKQVIVVSSVSVPLAGRTQLLATGSSNALYDVPERMGIRRLSASHGR